MFDIITDDCVQRGMIADSALWSLKHCNWRNIIVGAACGHCSIEASMV